MGMYQSDYIFTGTFPHLMARFVILIMYYELQDALQTDITFRVLLPSPPSEEEASSTIEVLMARNEINQFIVPPSSPPPEGEGSERIIHSRIPMAFSPLVIPQQGFIRVRAHYSDGAILRLGSLHVRARRPDEMVLP